MGNNPVIGFDMKGDSTWLMGADMNPYYSTKYNPGDAVGKGITNLGANINYTSTSGDGVNLYQNGRWTWAGMDPKSINTPGLSFDVAAFQASIGAEGLNQFADIMQQVPYFWMPGAGAAASVADAAVDAVPAVLDETAPAVVDNAAEEHGTYSVYHGFDKVTGVLKYVGITSRDVEVRWAEHVGERSLKFLDYDVVKGATGLSRQQARIWEQTIINNHGLENLLNKINSIATKYHAALGL